LKQLKSNEPVSSKVSYELTWIAGLAPLSADPNLEQRHLAMQSAAPGGTVYSAAASRYELQGVAAAPESPWPDESVIG